jgi:hypothetical protein
LGQIEVLVKDKSTGDQRTFTYKSFLDLQDRFELIGQCDEHGNLIQGDPNLNPRHQKVAVNDVAVHAVEPGMTMEEKLAKREELMKKYAPPIQETVDTPPIEVEKQRKKPGPKPKQAA